MNCGMRFGEIILEARKNLSLDQRSLAKKVLKEDGTPIGPQYICDIEHGRKTPSSDLIIKQLAVALNINADYLHYLNGRFPERERKRKMNYDQFDKAMAEFRRFSK
jgi:transcriptional regulator with XRE-family HTH domain